MKNIFVLFVFATCLIGCRKTCPSSNYASVPLYSFSTDSIIADHVSQTTIKISIPANATLDRRTLLVTIDSGTLIGSTNNQLQLNCVQDPSNTCYLFAQAVLISPSAPCWIHLYVIDGDVAFLDSIKVYPSVPFSMVLNPSAFTVADSLTGSVTLSGQVYNQSGNSVSNGYHVVFKEVWLPGSNSMVSGFTTNLHDTTNVAQLISMTFTPGFLPSDTTFYIISTVYNQQNQVILPVISDTIPIFIQ